MVKHQKTSGRRSWAGDNASTRPAPKPRSLTANSVPGSESALLERVRKLAGRHSRGVVLGIGDDCAIFRPRGAAEDLIFTTDLFLEDVHFRRATHKPADVG